VHDVTVGEDVTVWREDESGTAALSLVQITAAILDAVANFQIDNGWADRVSRVASV
jgi:hypothetical protein